MVATIPTRHTGRAATTSTIVTAIPTIAHTRMTVTGILMRPVSSTMVGIEATPAIRTPAMSAAIGYIEVRTPEVEIVTTRVVGINAEVPIACFPKQWTIEIGCCTECFPLPRIEDVAQVHIAALPVIAEHIITTSDTHQVVKVHLVGSLVLSIREVQLISHLIGKEQGLTTSLFITHGVAPDSHRKQGEKGHQILLHSRIVFCLLIIRVTFLFLMQRKHFSVTWAKDFP